MLNDWMLTLIACSLKLSYYEWRLRFVRQSSARFWWETAFQRRRIPRYFDFLGYLKSTPLFNLLVTNSNSNVHWWHFLIVDFKQTSNQPFHATATRYPSPAVRHPLLATRHLLPSTRYPPPAICHPSPAIRYPPRPTRHPWKSAAAMINLFLIRNMNGNGVTHYIYWYSQRETFAPIELT